jgi:excisionase family DNA binding protein
MLRHSGILISEISLDDFENVLRKIVHEEMAPHIKALSAPKQKVDDELISKKAAAALLKVSLPTISKLVRNGLPCHRLGSNIRFLKSEILASLTTVRNKNHGKNMSPNNNHL